MPRRGTRVGAGALLATALMLLVFMVPAWAATKTVTLTIDNVFEPGSVSIPVGDTVTFSWEGGFHDVTFGDGTVSGAPTADTTTTWSRSFSTAGSYPFVCSVHQASGMTGTITVQAAGGSGAGGSSEAALPMTGPEDTILPVVGLTMFLAGAAAMVVARRRKTR